MASIMNVKRMLIFFILGFFFRIILNRLVPQPVMYDQYQYYNYAIGIWNDGVFADRGRLYGYPLIILPLVIIWGISTQWPWLLFQSFIDCLTALLVYKTADYLFKNSNISFISYAIYLFNPFTSAYAGVLLTEVTAIFMTALIIYFLLLALRSLKLSLIYPLLIASGFLVQIRPSFFYFSAAVFLILSIKTIVRFKNIIIRAKRLTVYSAVFILPFLYTIFSNFHTYKQFSLLFVDNIFWREVYISSFVGRGLPFAGVDEWKWPSQAYEAWYEYHTPTTYEGRKLMALKYKMKSMSEIRRDPVHFISHHISKLWYVWEKHYLFPYINPPSVYLMYSIYILNLVLIMTALTGTVFYHIVSGKNKTGILLFILLTVYISATHIFSTSEERFSLPGYPFLAVYSGYAIFIFLKNLKPVRL